MINAGIPILYLKGMRQLCSNFLASTIYGPSGSVPSTPLSVASFASPPREPEASEDPGLMGTWRFMGSYKGSFKGPFKGIYRDSIRVLGFRAFLDVHG